MPKKGINFYGKRPSKGRKIDTCPLLRTPMLYVRHNTKRRMTRIQGLRDMWKHERPTSVWGWRYDKEIAKMGCEKPRRRLIGFVRAFGKKHFFAGAYNGAEFD